MDPRENIPDQERLSREAAILHRATRDRDWHQRKYFTIGLVCGVVLALALSALACAYFARPTDFLGLGALSVLLGCFTDKAPAILTPQGVQYHYVDTHEEARMAALQYAAKVGAIDFNMVNSGSMEPHFPAKRTIYVTEAGEPDEGTPTVFMHNGKPYIHLTKSKGLGRYTTQGTNPGVEDAGYRTKDDIKGVVRHVWISKEDQK